MRSLLCVRRSLSVSIVCCLVLLASAASAGDKPGRYSRGRALFMREWQANDPASPEGDGLGPMFNATSCVACHNQGGIGGAGANEHNVDVLSVDLSQASLVEIDRHSLAKALPSIHPGLVNNAITTVLHSSSTDAKYRDWRDRLAPVVDPGTTPPVRVLTPEEDVTLKLSQRSTPALFGAAAINAIPTGFLRQVAARQAKSQPRTAGRVSFGGVQGQPEGRFGWRGQIATLDGFVRGACAAEVGLQLPGHTQSDNPRRPSEPMKGYDMAESDVLELVRFVADLPQPRKQNPTDPKLMSLVNRGELMFNTIGCGACHMRSLGPINGIYSDLLLHDMGDNLADPGAEGTSGPSFGTASYYGSASSILVYMPDEKKQREWRTPPLWGVRDSAPYLHDGRAATLRDAIAMHGGQAEAAAKNFAVLGSEQQTRLLLFLNTLVAPQQAGE